MHVRTLNDADGRSTCVNACDLTVPLDARTRTYPQFGEGMGPAMRRVLLRLFLVLDANGSGVLEYEVRK